MEILSFLLVSFMVGISEAMLLFLIASGLTLIFGVLHILNFAHGSLYMLGAYLAFQFLTIAPFESFWLSVLVASLGVAVLGTLIEVAFIRKMYDRDILYQLLLTYGFVLIIDDVTIMIWGTNFKSISIPDLLSGSVSMLGSSFPVYCVFLIIAGPVIVMALWFLLHKTGLGLNIRAATLDREMATVCGVNSSRLFTTVFFIGCFLGGLGGALTGPMRVIVPAMGSTVIIQAFAVIVIGGMRSLKGAFTGAVLIGLIDSFGTVFVPGLSMFLMYILMAVILVVRPHGLFGME